jgi:hypothetical protein
LIIRLPALSLRKPDANSTTMLWNKVDAGFLERGYPPRIQQVQALLGFAVFAGILAMHVDAIDAAVDLRGAGLDQFDQRLLKAGCLHLRFQCAQRFDGVGRGLVKFMRGFTAVLHLV